MGEGAEIGVQRGIFAETILAAWGGRRLLCVDPWRTFPEGEYPDVANVAQPEHDALYAETLARLARFGDRARVIRATSLEAATRVPDGSLDFVYLDAQHHYEAVRADMAAWAPKVRAGGFLCGHDYIEDGDYWFGRMGVTRAVSEFVGASGRTLIVSGEVEDFPSWFVRM